MTAPHLRTASLRRRLSLWVLGLLAVLLVVLGVTVDLVLGANLRSELRDRLADRAEIAAGLVEQGRSDAEVLEAVTGDTVQAQLQTADGEEVGSIPDPPAPAPAPGPGGRPGPAPPAGAVVDTGDAYVLQTELSDGSRLTLVADQSPITDAVTQLRWILVLGSAVTLLLAAALVSATVGLGLRPLDRMTALARSITSGDRGRRLRPDRPTTELGSTAAAFDDMLDELEGAERAARRAEAGMRDLLGDAAHELRTPLAAVQASVETVLRTDPERGRREELLAGAVRELQRSGRLVADLLDVARFDSGDPPTLHPRPTDLLELARASARRVGGPVEVTGDVVHAAVDPDRVGQVLDNLVRNAVRAAGPSGHVWVDVAGEGTTALLVVTDDGPGVPADQRERIFDRLVRLDAARVRDGGAGLGLPIARALARAHGGDVVCLPAERGARFRVQLPVTSITG
ncbi:Signal transduction histidine kinase [Klenkia marina]|uniref:histidine kinase n=1 Tax=Klenkia marina TaxID=1960309 RepID=A0A1G4YUV2_9ACTN|nr:HAMP domain-containing sensor histidine kinase [Klenkia marina]SCX57249.1 Signal transduction histidine kinase [Klenkia marina]